MAFCKGCGKITWSTVGCKCTAAPNLRALVDVAREAARARLAQAERFPPPPPPPVQLMLPEEPDRTPLRHLVADAAECSGGRGHADLYEARIALARARRRGEQATVAAEPCAECGRWHVRVGPGR